MKKLLIASILFFAVAIGIGLIFQTTDAQTADTNTCQKEYNMRRSQCITDNNICVSSCTGNQNCELDCNTIKRNACDETATNLQRKCLGVWPYDQPADQDMPVVNVDTPPAPATQTPTKTTSPPPASAPAKTPISKPLKQPSPPTALPKESPTQSDNLSYLPKEIIVDENSYTVALIDIVPTKTELQKIISVAESPNVPITIGRNAKTDILFNIDNLLETQPTITFGAGGTGADTSAIASIDISAMLSEKNASDASKAKTDSNEPSKMTQTKITNIVNQNTLTSMNISLSKKQSKPLFILATGETTTGAGSSPEYVSDERAYLSDNGASVLLYPDSTMNIVSDLVVLDKDATDPGAVNIGDSALPDIINGITDNAAISLNPDIVFDISKGKAIFVAGWSASDTLSATSDFLSTLGNIGVRHKKTAYGVAVDSENKKKIVEIYDGEIDVFDKNTGAILATLSTEFGKDIKRVEIYTDGTLKQQIAIPRSKWSEFVAKNQKNSPNILISILTIIVTGAVGYLAYRKKDSVLGVFKKEPKQ